MGKYLGLGRTLSQIYGKEGVPSYRSRDKKSRIDFTEKGIVIQEKPDSNFIEQHDNYMVFHAVRDTYTPVAVYKALVKSKYGEVNDSTITCQIIVCTVNHATRIHYPENKKPRVSDTKYDFLYTTGRGQVERYNPEKHGIWEIKEDETGKLIVSEKNDVKYDVNLETKEVSVKKETEEYYFPLESHLRDFIAQNIDTIKVNGKSLKLYVDENGTDGIEFRTDVGIIDILALDE